MDSAEQLQRIYLAGFELQTFDRYPTAVGVIRDGCIALLRATPSGLQMIGSPGWRMGEVLGVLVEKDGREVFQAKSEIVEATPERLAALRTIQSRSGAVADGDGVTRAAALIKHCLERNRLQAVRKVGQTEPALQAAEKVRDRALCRRLKPTQARK